MNTTVKDIIKEESIAILVLARSSSNRVLNKNYRNFYKDKSMMDIKLDELIEMCGPKHIFVSSDIATSRVNFIRRSKESIFDNSLSFSEIITPIFNKLYQKGFKHVLITYPTSPLFNKEMYAKVIHEYYTNIIKGDKTSAVTGHYENGYFWMDGKEMNYEATAEGHAYTQFNKKVFSINNAVYIKKLIKEKNHYMFNRDSVHFIEIPRVFGIDVDTKEDYIIAQELYKSYTNNQFNGVY